MQLTRHQKYYSKYREQILEKERVRRSNPEYQRYMKDYYQQNKQRLNQMSVEYNRTNESYKKWKKDWTQKYEKLPQVKERKKLFRQTSENYKKGQNERNKKLRESGWFDAYFKEYRKKNKSKLSLKNQKHYKEHPEIYLRSRLKTFARLGKVFNLSNSEYIFALVAWSKTVKKLHNGLCQICLIPAEHSHHILHKAKYPELSLNPNNGIPLCKQHHYEVHGMNLGVI